MQITTIGLDIAKHVFQVHGIDAEEKVVVRRQLRRGQVMQFFEGLSPCLVGLEACATSHYWARELSKLGHEVRLMPAKDVKAYVKRNKNDAADAEAICEAVRRPTMRFVQVKSAEQQAHLMQHRARDLLMQQRTQLINSMRSHSAELGIIAPQGRQGVKELLAIAAKDANMQLPNDARASLVVLAAQLHALQTTIAAIEKRIVVQHRANKESRRLQTIPGIGPIGASAIAATVTNPKIFRSGRDFAAWIGLVPRQMSTGGKAKLGPISKQGDRYLRRLLVVGAVSTLRRAKLNPQRYPWVTRLLARRPFKVVAVALANKMARIAWALLIGDKPVDLLGLRQREKELADGSMRLRWCVEELQGVMTTLMRTVETVDREDPRHVPCETRARAFGWDPIRGLHQGQRPRRPHLKAVYMAAPDPLVEMSDFPLAPRAPSIHGTSRHFAASRQTVALGRKADIEKMSKRGASANAGPSRTKASVKTTTPPSCF